MTKNASSSTSARRVRSTQVPAMAHTTSTAPTASAVPMPMATLATIVEVGTDGTVLVALAGQSPVLALVATPPGSDLIRAWAESSPVLVVAVDGDPRRPAIIGVVGTGRAKKPMPMTATVDGRRVKITGQDEVVLTCGKASITLTKEGRIILRGSHLAAASTGLNRITGGSVQIN